MFRYNIQLFGGRGSRSGIGAGGPGIGLAFTINAARNKKSSKIPEYKNYPEYPDPDYSNYNVITKDKFINDTYKLLDYKRINHFEVGKKYLSSLNLNQNIKFTNINDDSSVGYILSTVDSDGNTVVLKYNLNSADTRRMEYKVKTMIHEGYHASADGLPDQRTLSKISDNKYSYHEETRTEMSAMYLANKLNGFTYVPSYTKEVVSAAAKYKRLPEFSNCKTLNDLGEKFYNERMVNKKNPSFYEIENSFKSIQITDEYYTKYYKNIIKNQRKYYEVCESSLFNFEYYNIKLLDEYKKTYDNMINKVKILSKSKKVYLTSAEEQLFIQCVAISMNDGGIL